MAAFQFKVARSREVEHLYTSSHLNWHSDHSFDSNKSCGVAVGPDKRKCPSEFVTRVERGTGELQGRAILPRYRRGRHDLAFLPCYFPARGTGRGAVARQKRICELLAWFMQRRLDELPTRCVPPIGMYLNSARGEHISARPVAGGEEPERDGPNYLQLRPTLQAHQLALVNTFHAAGP
eukprot:5710583-Pyramimonas_sp.AAC.1